MDVNYTKIGPIVRDSRWPAVGSLRVNLVCESDSWPSDAENWTWQMVFSGRQGGGDPDLVLTATDATVAGSTIQLEFHARPSETRLLAGSGERTYYVKIRSRYLPTGTTTTTPFGEDLPDVRVYAGASGYVIVVDMSGELS